MTKHGSADPGLDWSECRPPTAFWLGMVDAFEFRSDTYRPQLWDHRVDAVRIAYRRGYDEVWLARSGAKGLGDLPPRKGENRDASEWEAIADAYHARLIAAEALLSEDMKIKRTRSVKRKAMAAIGEFLTPEEVALCADPRVPLNELHLYPSEEARARGESPVVLKLNSTEGGQE